MEILNPRSEHPRCGSRTTGLRTVPAPLRTEAHRMTHSEAASRLQLEPVTGPLPPGILDSEWTRSAFSNIGK
jgi:hypothetical protein